jgi:glutathione S-transferase
MAKLTVHHLQIGQGERIPFLLEELNLPYELKTYKRSPLLSPPDLKAKHPMGASPVLEDATFDAEHPLVLAESNAIAEYIIHKHGNGRLALPPTHPNYADYLYWFHFCNATLLSNLFRKAGARGMVGEEDPRFKGYEARLRNAVANVNGRLAANKYLAGDEFTVADVMTMCVFTTLRKFEPIDLTEYEGVLAWLKRVAERPAYRRAMQKSDPELDLEAGISAKGPPLVELFAKAMALKM